MADTNITVVVEEPRPGDGLKKAALTRPGALITLIALTPEAGASMAVLKWRNPYAQSQVLELRSMQVYTQELPLQQGSSHRAIDLHKSRAALLAVLPEGPPTADEPVFIFTKDSRAAAEYFLHSKDAKEAVRRSHAALDWVRCQPFEAGCMLEQLPFRHHAVQVVANMPVSHIGQVPSGELARSLGINYKTRKTSVALKTAKAAFPQVEDQFKTVKDHVGQANALLVAAHVVGATLVQHPDGAASPHAPAVEAPPAIAAQPAMPITPSKPAAKSRRRTAATAAAGGTKRKRKGGAAAAAGGKRQRSAAKTSSSAAAAAARSSAASAAAQLPSRAGMRPEGLAALRRQQQAQAAAPPPTPTASLLLTPQQQAVYQHMMQQAFAANEFQFLGSLGMRPGMVPLQSQQPGGPAPGGVKLEGVAGGQPSLPAIKLESIKQEQQEDLGHIKQEQQPEIKQQGRGKKRIKAEVH
ncbi:hypothetical protein ACK3TF_002726 [Chlorella vulgaris]